MHRLTDKLLPVFLALILGFLPVTSALAGIVSAGAPVQTGQPMNAAHDHQAMDSSQNTHNCTRCESGATCNSLDCSSHQCTSTPASLTPSLLARTIEFNLVFAWREATRYLTSQPPPSHFRPPIA